MEEKKEFSKYLETFMQKHDYKLEYLADMTGASVSAIGHYKTGNRTPKDDFIEKFIEVFNLDSKEQNKIKLAVAMDRTPDIIKQQLNNKSNEIIDTDFMVIPVYSSVSAGLGCEACAEPVDYITIPKINGKIIAIKVNGDSMEDTILDGATILVKKDTPVELGEIGVFLTNDIDYAEGFVKRLRHKNGTYVLESDNKKYEDIIIKTDDIIACGKVLKVINDTQKRLKDPLYEYIDKIEPEKRKLAEKMLKALIEEE
ncbi:helix-turn-helix domain-containing protein [Fusobacterium mortiferum]|uniref:helix-turn-helix domain-containing protein n=1 Tax=Fusobacterium mortiferum TaxID=850 RepID=UPI001F1D6F8C|nr:S24 family peptidase [Fusobacterium mortiferum]MCF2628978.1 helix-turn-helix domain-containing protein [Fusobacterium mortiferum]